MGKQITTHRDAGLNEKIQVQAVDEPGSGGAYHQYQISVNNVPCVFVPFQNGGVREVGPNGISAESLLAIVEDRLACFQAAPFACKENQEALDHVRAAMKAMHDRTASRSQRGVEGTQKA